MLFNTHMHARMVRLPKWMLSSIIMISAKVWQCIMSSLNGLGERLAAMNLTSSTVDLIWTLAGKEYTLSFYN